MPGRTPSNLKLSPRRIGIMGFSAGGHLASTAATHFDAGQPDHPDPVERLSCRPDFAVLGYPVISFTESFGHKGSVRNLLGDNPTAELLDLLSNEKQVTKETPPTFLVSHRGRHRVFRPENSVAFYMACRKAGVPAELHVYRFGPHGVGLSPGDPVTFTWKDRLADWLRASGLVGRRRTRGGRRDHSARRPAVEVGCGHIRASGFAVQADRLRHGPQRQVQRVGDERSGVGNVPAAGHRVGRRRSSANRGQLPPL